MMKINKTVLLVDDESDLLFILGEAFRSEGFEVVTAMTADDGLKLYYDCKPDLVISDVAMPGKNGMELVRAIRETDRRTPIFLLTSVTAVGSAVAGFEAGANDYIRKPFSTPEVIARAKAATDFQNSRYPGRIAIGKFEFDANTHTLFSEGREIRLSSMESSILGILVANINVTVKTETILKSLGKTPDFFSSRSLQVHIVKLRKVLSEDSSVSIVTERLVGYRLTV